jgi:hypothetical protein
MGIMSSAVNLTGNKISAAAVENAVVQLNETLNSSDVRTVVIYSIFDNNTFFCAGEDGSRTLPAKNGDDRYHVAGRLVVAGHDVIKSLVNMSIPLLRAGGEREKIILSPLPRYIIPCCGDEAHITNRGEPNFKQDLMSQLAEAKKSIKDLVFGKKLRKFRVVDPIDLMYEEDGDGGETRKRGFWKTDPVHPTAGGYQSLLEGIIKTYEESCYNRDYAPGDTRGQRTPEQRRHRRQSWVTEDDTTAHRVYVEFPRGRGSGKPRAAYGGNRGPPRGAPGRGGRGRGGYNGGDNPPKRGSNGSHRSYKKGKFHPY